MGMNVSGKSTIIHARTCCYKPRNSFSFMTSHGDEKYFTRWVQYVRE